MSPEGTADLLDAPALAVSRAEPARPVAAPGPFVLDGLLWGAEAAVLPYLTARRPDLRRVQSWQARAIGFLGPTAAGGLGIVGGVAFCAYYPHPEGGDVQAEAWAEPGARITRAALRRVLAYAFGQLGCRRISFRALRGDRAARRLAVRLGFRVEATIREACGRQDVIAYGLLRSDLRRGLPPIRKRTADHG